MRAVLDTNVIVSASLSAGSPPDRILQAWRRRAFEMIISEPLLRELEGVISRPKIADRVGWSGREQRDLLRDLRARAVVVAPERKVDVVTADPSDNRVLEAAVEGSADYIVTGDRHLLDLQRHESTDIVTPARFLAILATEGIDQ